MQEGQAAVRGMYGLETRTNFKTSVVNILTPGGWVSHNYPFYLAIDPLGYPYPIHEEAFKKSFQDLEQFTKNSKLGDFL